MVPDDNQLGASLQAKFYKRGKKVATRVRLRHVVTSNTIIIPRVGSTYKRACARAQEGTPLTLPHRLLPPHPTACLIPHPRPLPALPPPRYVATPYAPIRIPRPLPSG